MLVKPHLSHCVTCTMSLILTVLSIDKYTIHFRDDRTEISRCI